MDERRIQDALRAGPEDETRYQALGRAGLLDGRSGRTRAGRRAGGWVPALVVGAVLLAALLAMPLWIVGGPDRLDRITRGGTIRMAVSAGPPQVVTNAGVASGFDVDVAMAVARELGVRPLVEAVDPVVLEAGGWSDRWDIALDSAVTTPERVSVLRAGRPYATHVGAILVGGSSGVSRLEDLARATVCVPSDGGLAARWLEGTLALVDGMVAPVPDEIQIVTEPDLRGCTERVRERSADALVADWELDVEPVPSGLRRVGAVPFAGVVSPVTAGSPEGDDRLLEAVDRALGRLRDEGTLRELSQRRFGGRDLTQLP
jgi:ABC-type amino acid transport substrate-binding protein